jgi:hypothetical protein
MVQYQVLQPCLSSISASNHPSFQPPFDVCKVRGSLILYLGAQKNLKLDDESLGMLR